MRGRLLAAATRVPGGASAPGRQVRSDSVPERHARHRGARAGVIEERNRGPRSPSRSRPAWDRRWGRALEKSGARNGLAS